MIVIYGVIDLDGSHLDVGLSLRGAKLYATKNGFNKVSMRVGSFSSIVSVRGDLGGWNRVG